MRPTTSFVPVLLVSLCNESSAALSLSECRVLAALLSMYTSTEKFSPLGPQILDTLVLYSMPFRLYQGLLLCQLS